MKKLNTTNAIAILALGFTLVVVAVGCGGNDTTESALTKNAALSAPTTTAKVGSSNGGTGQSVTHSNDDLENLAYVASLTNSQMNALTSEQWELVDFLLSASQVASIPLKTIKNLSTKALEGLSATGTQALTNDQLNSMSKDQLNALISSGELTDDQKAIVNASLTKQGQQIVSTISVLSLVDCSASDRTFNSCNRTKLNDWRENENFKCN